MLVSIPAVSQEGYECEPTPGDEMGPFYQPGAVLRNSVGTGYLLFGSLKSAQDCSLIPNARIEVWMAGPGGDYGDEWRATLFSSVNGAYYFQSHEPPSYGTGRAHIHIKVTSEGFEPLVTQHYPARGAGEGIFDLTLVPKKQ